MTAGYILGKLSKSSRYIQNTPTIMCIDFQWLVAILTVMVYNSAPFELNFDFPEVFSWKTAPQKDPILVLFPQFCSLLGGLGPPGPFLRCAYELVTQVVLISKIKYFVIVRMN